MRTAHQQHQRLTLTRNGLPEAVLLSVDDLDGLETTLEVLADADSVANIAAALAERGHGDPGTDLRQAWEELHGARAGSLRTPTSTCRVHTEPFGGAGKHVRPRDSTMRKKFSKTLLAESDVS